MVAQAVAQYKGAIERIFRKTDQAQLPWQNGGKPGKITITLFDCPKLSREGHLPVEQLQMPGGEAEEVDIVIDERLCSKANESGLLGALPSVRGEVSPVY